MNILFGMDVHNKKSENGIKKENDKSIDEIYQLIKLIDKSKKKKKIENRKINEEKLLIPSNSTYYLKNIHIRKTNNFINSTYSQMNDESNTFVNNSNTNIQNILNRYLNDNYLTKKVNKVIYHRKINSSLIGEYLNKLDLPSNVNVVNSLKKANEAFANNVNNCQNQIGFNKNIKFEPIYRHNTKIIIKNKNFKNFNSNNITRDNTNISNTFGTPMKKEITFSNFSNIKNTEIPNLKKRNKYIKNFIGKIYTRNINSPSMNLNNSKKMITINDSSSKKYIKKNLLLTSLQNSDIKTLNKYNNSSKKEIYSKPKALYQNKNNGFSLKKFTQNCKA